MKERITIISGERRFEENLKGKAPQTVDVSLTGRCQLRCAWCWGPEHTLKESTQKSQWTELFNKLATNGTSHVVFTGGDPLISPMLPDLLQLTKQKGLRTTLSTNAILLREKQDLLQYVDDLGIPIDGASSEMNDIMRARADRFNGWEKAIDGMCLAQSRGVPVTARTVISRKNIHDIPNIPDVLEEQGVDLNKLRVKMYQIEPIGPHVTNVSFNEWAITEEEALATAKKAKERYPNLDITLQLYKDTRGRYFQVDPLGNSYGTDLDINGLPSMVDYGNLFTNYTDSINNYQKHKNSLTE